MRTIVSPKGYLNSVYPCTSGLTFNPWIYMVPQYRPNSVLILGYGGGTTAGLIKMVYGDVPITGVDIEFYENPYAVEFVKADAEQYIKDCSPVDVIIVDIWVDDKVAGCVTRKSFVDDVSKKCNYLIVHVHKYTDMRKYLQFKCKTIQWEDHKFFYFVVNNIPPIRCLGL